MSARKRRWNIKGAPFRIGQFVKVVKATDDTCKEGFIGAVGRVIWFEYDCGCGQTFPGDPMIGVRFMGGTVEEFWAEELKVFGLKDA